MRTFQSVSMVALLSLSALMGCSNAPSGDENSPSPVVNGPPPATVDVHDHPTEGPHHGDLIELGNEEYHAEIVHGQGGEVMIYILDSSASKPSPIAAKEVTINLTHDGQAEQFKLLASPDANDPAGQSSRFVLKDEELASDLDNEGTTAKLVLNVNGKQYNAAIEHHHEGDDHAGHAH